MKPATVLTVAALSGIPALTALGLALTVHRHPQPVTFTDQGVNVALRLSDDGDRLLTTFTPQRPGFRLAARPTRVEVAGALRSRGPLVARVPGHPDDPLTTEMPVVVDEHGDARVVVSYTACSPRECLTPVKDHPVEIPAGMLAAMR